MTTITIEQTRNLQKTNFTNIDDLLTHLLFLTSSEIEYENFSNEEQNIINSLDSSKKFKNIIKNLKI